jgi:hypothetical protein
MILENMLDAQDPSKGEGFNERIEKGQMLMGEWLAELHDLCNENGVEMQ